MPSQRQSDRSIVTTWPKKMDSCGGATYGVAIMSSSSLGWVVMAVCSCLMIVLPFGNWRAVAPLRRDADYFRISRSRASAIRSSSLANWCSRSLKSFRSSCVVGCGFGGVLGSDITPH